eukprot:GILJ01005396.1.p1 GENE.GILJ01005396.1~~GILJ01005396.1.p1  ORF type:complete len:418 (+),score=76.93 GILJ01005396.1:143-1255(+)
MGESFVLLPNAGAAPSGNKQNETNEDTAGRDFSNYHDMVSRAQKLLSLASEKTQVEHPLCLECADGVWEAMERQLEEAESDRDIYLQTLEALEAEFAAAGTQNELSLDDEDRALLEEEEALKAKLAELQLEETQIQTEMKEIEEKEQELSVTEKKYWEEFNQLEYDMETQEEEQAALTQKVELASEQLDRLKKTNVLNDVFHIWHDGHFGTINDLRLGRLPSQPVSWDELNAAWGQTCLLLATMAKKCAPNFQFSTYKLLPMGSFSKIAKIGDEKNALELYGGDGGFGRLFYWGRRFDTAMIWFLVCLKELGEFAEGLDAGFRLPYKIDGDKIADVSIKLQFNQDEKWTKALKYMLTSLKWLLAWCTRQS